MASGDTIYDQNGFVVVSTTSSTDPVKVTTSFNKGGTTANTRQNATLESFASNPAVSGFDVTKQYQIIIKEV